MSGARHVLLLLALCLLALAPSPAGAQEDSEAPEVTRARAAFVQGAALAKDARWGEALERFEVSAKLRPHAGTSYNIGVCQRALGQYTRARGSLRRALEQDRSAHGVELAESLRADINAMLGEMAAIVATLHIELNPPEARLAIDGRPLAALPGKKSHFVAGVRDGGPGRAIGVSRFDVDVDPGLHVIVVGAKGYSDVAQRVNVGAGSQKSLKLTLDRLPATLHVEANRRRAAVSVDGVDVGLAPVTLSRPPGRYRVTVQKQGHVSYSTDAVLNPGERADLKAVLDPEPVLLTERWWFWTGIGVALVGIAAGTYFLTRPDPERPPVSGGGLGWAVSVP